LKKYLFSFALMFLGVVYLTGCGGKSVLLLPSADMQFEAAKKEYDKKHYLKAIEGFQKTIFNFPGATVVDTAQYYLAMSYFQNEEFELASVEFNRLMLNYPRSDFADEAQYMVGICYTESTPGHYALDQQDLRKAITALEDFLVDNPDSPLVPEAKDRIKEARNKLARKAYENGITYFKMYSYEASRVYFQHVIDEYTDTDYAPEALFKYAESLYKEKKYTEADEKFHQFLGVYPVHPLKDKVDGYLRKIADSNIRDKEENAAAATD